jgi:hypothetical protein
LTDFEDLKIGAWTMMLSEMEGIEEMLWEVLDLGEVEGRVNAVKLREVGYILVSPCKFIRVLHENTSW